MIDPSGNRTGFDPGSKSFLAQIPQSSHFVDLSGDAVTEQEPIGSIHTVSIGQPPAGVYEVQVIGQNNGLFDLDGSQSFGNTYTTSSVLGSTDPESVSSYFFHVGDSTDLSLSSNASTNSANIGDTLTYTLVVTNSGSNEATGVTLIDNVPQGVSLVSVNGALYRYDDTSRKVKVSLESMTSGASAMLSLVVVVSPTATGTLTNTATVSSFESDTNPSDNSTSVNVTVIGQTLTAVSRKAHGGAGSFDINLPLTGIAGIECRAGGASNDYQIVLNFPNSVTVNGTPQAQITSGQADIGTGGVNNGGAITVSGNIVTVPLTNVTSAQTLNVTLFDVNGAGNVVVPMSVLVGDTTGNGTVNSNR